LKHLHFTYTYISLTQVETDKQLNVRRKLWKTRYSPYSSCCSTDLQGHPKSMIFISSKRAYAISY